MTDQDFYAAVQAMVTYGGSFVSALGRTGLAGDAPNRARLLAAFPEYFAEYLEVAKMKEAQP